MKKNVMLSQRSKKYINQHGEGSGFVYFLMIMMLVKMIMMVKIKMAKDLALFVLSSSFSSLPLYHSLSFAHNSTTI